MYSLKLINYFAINVSSLSWHQLLGFSPVQHDLCDLTRSLSVWSKRVPRCLFEYLDISIRQDIFLALIELYFFNRLLKNSVITFTVA